MPGPVHDAPFLDCCANPQVASIKTLYQESHDSEALCRCQSCGGFWFWRFHEYVAFMDEDDDWTVWYSRLTPEQGNLILEAEIRPDLSFLEKAPSLRTEMVCGRGRDSPWM